MGEFVCCCWVVFGVVEGEVGVFMYDFVCVGDEILVKFVFIFFY